MVRRIVAALACVAIGVIVGTAAFSSAAPAKTVHVIEHAKTDTLVDIGASGDTTGDLLTFHNPVFDSANSQKVGHDQGECIRIFPGAGTWECRWVTYLSGGHITVEGPFSDKHDTVLSITGGTGSFANATGQMQLKSRKGGTQFDFIFELG